MKLTNHILRTFSAGFVLLLSAQTSNAQQVCTVRDEAAVQLAKQFDEQVAGRGLTANSKRMPELFVSETGSWTLLASDPSGSSCVVVSGQAWQKLAQPVGDPA